MSIRKIGIDAGIVWQILNDAKDRSCSYDELKLKSKLSDNALNRALGWLAREDKLEIDDKSQIISLPHFSFF